jgi:hypothetical protein
MAEIKEEDLVKLYSEIEVLENQNKELKEGFINLKQNSNKAVKQNKYGKWLLLIILVLFFGFWYLSYKSKKEIYVTLENQKSVLLDSIYKISNLIPAKFNPEVFYSIQLGVYKKLDIQFSTDEVVNFSKNKTDIGNAYQIGAFLRYKTASEFKNEIKKLGLKDAFLIAYNKQKKRIHIREALVLSNEEEFLKD